MFFLQLVPPGPLLRAPLLAGWQGGLRSSVGAGRVQEAEATGSLALAGPDPLGMPDCPPPPIIAPSRPPVPVAVLLKRLLGSGDPLLPPLHPCSQGQSPAPRPPRSLSEQKWLLRLVGRAHSPCINWQTERGCHGRPARAPEDPGCEMEHHI